MHHSKSRRSLPIRFALTLGIVLIVFGWWGRSTQRGQTLFDEMAGMIPEACFYIGPVLVVTALTALIISQPRRR